MTNSEKLRALADWFDQYDAKQKNDFDKISNQVQSDLRAMATEFEQLNKPVVMQGLPDSEIYRWLQSKNYQYSYDETQEYRMLFELDFPKIIREFVAEHGSPTVGKERGDASVSDGK